MTVNQVKPTLRHVFPYLDSAWTKKKTALEIRDFLSGEFESLALSDLMEYLKVQEKLGNMKMMRK